MHRTAGFSLVEVMCAILILGVGVVGLTEGLTTALRSSKESEVQTTAVLIAAGQIEQLRAEGYILDGDTEGDCGTGLALYRWKQKITGAGLEGLHEVTVLVENSKTGQEILELKTLLFDPPLVSTQDGSSGGRRDSSRKNRGGRR
jgi:prepilin-type N-terminal cleavage/methylation domain-containing protein